jgi:hypothetical protein
MKMAKFEYNAILKAQKFNRTPALYRRGYTTSKDLLKKLVLETVSKKFKFFRSQLFEIY